MRVAYVGFTTMMIPGADKNLPEFKAPSNYKDAVKISNYIEEAKQKFIDGLADDPLAAQIHKFAVVREEGGKPVITLTDSPVPFAETLGANDAIAVFNPVRFLKFLTADTLTRGGKIGPDTAWTVRGESMGQALLPFIGPSRNMSTNNFVFDPMRMFCPSTYEGTDVDRAITRYSTQIGKVALEAIADEIRKLTQQKTSPAAVLALKTYALGKLAAY